MTGVLKSGTRKQKKPEGDCYNTLTKDATHLTLEIVRSYESSIVGSLQKLGKPKK